MINRYQKALQEKLEREHKKKEKEVAHSIALNNMIDEVG
jgi:hypothetical protein